MFEYTLRHNFTKKQRYDSFLSSELISTDQNDIYYFDQSKFAVNKFTLPENISKDCNQWDLIPVELKFEQILSDITDVLKIKVYKNFLYFVTLTSFNTYDLDTKSLKSISLMYGEWNFTILAEKIFLYSQTLNIFNVVQQNKAELDFISLPSSPINILQVNEQIIIVFSQFFAIYSIQLNLLKQIPVPAKVDVVAAQMNECHLILASKQRQILKVSIEGKVLGTIQAATKYDPQQIFFIDDSIILQSRSHEVIRQSFTQKNDRFSGVRGDAPWVGGEISQGTFVGLTEGEFMSFVDELVKMHVQVSENAYQTLGNVQFFRELINERLSDISLIVLSFYLSLVPYVDTVENKTYAYFTIIFMHIYLLCYGYDISYTHFINQQHYFSGLQLLDTIYPIPAKTKNIAYLQVVKYCSILIQNFVIVSLMSRFILQQPYYLLAIYIPVVIFIPIFIYLGYVVANIIK